MSENPFHDLNWWAAFIRSDEVLQNEMLTRAMCRQQGLPFAEYERLSRHFLELGTCRYSSGYDGPFDRRFFYPLHVGFELCVQQRSGRLELHTADRMRCFDDKTVLITKADPGIDWQKACREVIEDIAEMHPHIPAWHEALRINHMLEQLHEPDDQD